MVAGICNSFHRLLRRTLVRSVILFSLSESCHAEPDFIVIIQNIINDRRSISCLSKSEMPRSSA
jgi:hypothetical protein